jgi:predicted Zn-dependent protease
MTENDFQLTAPVIVFPGQGPESAYRVAYDLLAQRMPREALELIERALAEDPTNTGLRCLRAWAYMLRAQLQKAETELRDLIEETPDDIWSRHALGRVLERQSRLEEALPHLKMAAVMSGDIEHELAMLRVERLLLTRGESG